MHFLNFSIITKFNFVQQVITSLAALLVRPSVGLSVGALAVVPFDQSQPNLVGIWQDTLAKEEDPYCFSGSYVHF